MRSRLFIRVTNVFTDLAAHLTLMYFWNLINIYYIEPIFDFQKKTQVVELSKFLRRGRLLTNFEKSPRLSYSEYQKVVFVNVDQWPKVHLVSNVQPDL